MDSLLDCCCPCCKNVDMIHRREIYLNESKNYSRNYTKFSNRIKNQKYNFITFFPLALLKQFRFFNNQFYLLMTLSQFVDELKDAI